VLGLRKERDKKYYKRSKALCIKVNTSSSDASAAAALVMQLVSEL
jgi:hypothetical protein